MSFDLFTTISKWAGGGLAVVLCLLLWREMAVVREEIVSIKLAQVRIESSIPSASDRFTSKEAIILSEKFSVALDNMFRTINAITQEQISMRSRLRDLESGGRYRNSRQGGTGEDAP